MWGLQALSECSGIHTSLGSLDSAISSAGMLSTLLISALSCATVASSGTVMRSRPSLGTGCGFRV